MRRRAAVHVLLPLLGTALLLLLAADVLTTVFRPHGRGGAINRLQSRATWVVFRAVGARLHGASRRRLLAYCGPLLAVFTITTWAVLLVLGFALVYYPFMEHFHVAGVRGHADWVLALYYSGYTASTLGLGDLAPRTPGLRLLTVVESMAGFALLAIAVSYVLAVYRELGTSTTLALHLHGYFAGDGDRVGVLARRQITDAGGGDWMDGITRDLLRVTQAHQQYPILQYFHTPAPEQSLLEQIGWLVRLLPAAGRLDGPPPGRSALALEALRRAVERYVGEVDGNTVPGRFGDLPADHADVSLERRYARVLAYMLCERPEEEASSE